MTSSSIAGGGTNTTLYTNLTTEGTGYALKALHGLGSYTIQYDPSAPPTSPTVYDIVNPVPNTTYVVPPNDSGPGAGPDGFVVAGDVPVTIDDSHGAYGNVLVGNNAGDTFDLGGNSATVVTGDSEDQPDTINMDGGRLSLDEGGGNVVVNFTSSNAPNQANYIEATGTGKLTINVSDGSTLNLGAGNDTIIAQGAATVFGGSGTETFFGGPGSTQFTAGSGSETLYGGSGPTTFYASSTGGTDSIVGGSGANTIWGGGGTATEADTLVSGASLYPGATDIFDFSSASSVSGGTHTIQGFTSGQDTINLHGYTSGDIANFSYSGNSTVIQLDDGTTITVQGVEISKSSITYN